MEDGTLTVAALMLMGRYPQRWLPAFTVRYVSFVGNSIGGTEFRDKNGNDADGNAIHYGGVITTTYYDAYGNVTNFFLGKAP